MSDSRTDDIIGEKHEFVRKVLPSDELSKPSRRERASQRHRPGREKGKGSVASSLNKVALEAASPVDEKKIEQELTEIYENPDGSMPDMRSFEQRKRRRLARALGTLLAACVFLAAVAWVGFFVLQPPTRFSEDKVSLTVAGDEQVAIGQEVRYRIRYRNAQNVFLRNVLLQVRYPEGFVLTDTGGSGGVSADPDSDKTVTTSAGVQPSNEAKDEWRLGDLPGNASGYIDIFGRLYGDAEQKQSWRVFLNYTPSNFSSEFQKVNSATVRLTPPPLALALEAPEQVVAGGEFVLKVIVDKTGPERLPNMAVTVEENNFVIKRSDPATDQFVKNRWALNPESESQTIIVRGALTPDSGSQSGTITVKVRGWKDEKRDGDGYVYATAVRTVRFSQTSLSPSFVINGAVSALAVQPGEALNTTIGLKNAGQKPLNNLIVRVIFDAPSANRRSLLHWARLEDPADGEVRGEQLNAERRRGAITWDRRQLAALRQLDPGREHLIDFSLPLQSGAETDLTAFTTSEIEATMEVQYELEGKRELFTSAPIKLIVNSDTELDVRDTVSEAGGKERHTVGWLLTNSWHELKEVRVEADLFGDFTWDEAALSVPAGKAIFDREKKKLLWTMETMPVAVDVLALQFVVTLNSKNPTQTNLTSKVKLRARDTITGKEILKVKDGVGLR